MPIPSTIDDISIDPDNNSPNGGDPVGLHLDDYLRSIQSIIKQESYFTQPATGAVPRTVQEKLGEFISAADYASLAAAIAYAKASNKRVRISDSTIVNIPTDAGTMQDACDYLYADGKAIVTLKFEPGHAITHGLKLEYGDWSMFRIESADAVTYLSAGFVGVAVETTMSNVLIAGKYAKMPVLACLIQADDKCSVGYELFGGSHGFVAPGCGVTHAGAFGLYVLNNSSCNAPAANFSYSGMGNRVTTNSRLEAEGINCSNTQNRGWPDPSGDRCALDVSRGSVVNVKSQGTNITNFSGSANDGLTVRRSFVSAEGINAANCAKAAIRAEADCWVAASISTLTNAGDLGVYAAGGSCVDVSGSTITGCTNYAIYGSNGARVSAKEANCSGTVGLGRAVYAAHGSQIDAQSVNASGALSVGFYALHGSIINASGATCDMTGSGAGSYAVLSDYGSTINASLGAFSNATSGQELRCTRGSTISASGATGNPSKALNTVDANGVIYR